MKGREEQRTKTNHLDMGKPINEKKTRAAIHSREIRSRRARDIKEKIFLPAGGTFAEREKDTDGRVLRRLFIWTEKNVTANPLV